MRAVILTAPGHEQTYVAQALAAALGTSLVGLVVEHRTASLGSAWKRYPPLRVAERLITKVVRKALRHDQRRAAALEQYLGPDRGWPAVATIDVPSVNSSEAHAFITAQQPTHLLVYGTGIVGKATRALAYPLNLHTGLSPIYRGSDTEFWPLYEGRPEAVGVTVHECVADVDAGPIFDVDTVPMNADDDPFTAFAKQVQFGARRYANVCRRLAAGERLTPTPQRLEDGRAFKFIDRTFVEDLRMEWRMRSGQLRKQLGGQR